MALSTKTAATDTDDPVVLYTENFPPYNYEKAPGELAGLSVDIVRQVMEETGLRYKILHQPWARAYREAMRNPKGLIFSLARSWQREDQFDWLVLLAQPEFYLFGREGDERQVTFEAIKRGEFSAVCEENDASCAILRDAGFPENRLFTKGDGSVSETTMVEYGRVDFYLDDINHTPFRLKKLKRKSLNTKPVLKVGKGLKLYLAAGLHVNTEIRQKIHSAYQRLVAAGELSSKEIRE